MRPKRSVRNMFTSHRSGHSSGRPAARFGRRALRATESLEISAQHTPIGDPGDELVVLVDDEDTFGIGGRSASIASSSGPDSPRHGTAWIEGPPLSVPSVRSPSASSTSLTTMMPASDKSSSINGSLSVRSATKRANDFVQWLVGPGRLEDLDHRLGDDDLGHSTRCSWRVRVDTPAAELEDLR